VDVLKEEIEQTFGIPIDYYIYVDLKGFVALVDELEAGSFFCEQYGVKIAEEDGDCAQIRGITTSAVRIDELMTTLVEQQVSPTVLEDVVQDWL
jgi:hypothetical protein